MVQASTQAAAPGASPGAVAEAYKRSAGVQIIKFYEKPESQYISQAFLCHGNMFYTISAES
jgi:hypothetical protein